MGGCARAACLGTVKQVVLLGVVSLNVYFSLLIGSLAQLLHTVKARIAFIESNDLIF